MDTPAQFNDSDVERFPTFEEALQQLSSAEGNMPDPEILYGLSGLMDSQIRDLRTVWGQLDAAQRQLLLQMMIDAAYSNLELDFEPIGVMALDADSDVAVRRTAIELLFESESIETLMTLRNILEKDTDLFTQVNAARALGNFVLLAELGKIMDSHVKPVRDHLLRLLNNSQTDLLLRAAALESIANCTNSDVTSHINHAYGAGEPELRRSAVIAMGRTCDDRWSDYVLDELSSGDEEFQAAAARAAGELQIEEAIPAFTRIYAESDVETRLAIVWALGEIGGREATRMLENAMEEAESEGDDVLIEAIEDAIGNAGLLSGDLLIGNFDMPLDE
ncbi:MAG: HEAT repeat domain-containing protein [Anaerolineaceae bacterium]|nr:HEAT repeat domain-containing protein [Anaerolineaceae bacterium]